MRGILTFFAIVISLSASAETREINSYAMGYSTQEHSTKMGMEYSAAVKRLNSAQFWSAAFPQAHISLLPETDKRTDKSAKEYDMVYSQRPMVLNLRSGRTGRMVSVQANLEVEQTVCNKDCSDRYQVKMTINGILPKSDLISPAMAKLSGEGVFVRIVLEKYDGDTSMNVTFNSDNDGHVEFFQQLKRLQVIQSVPSPEMLKQVVASAIQRSLSKL